MTYIKIGDKQFEATVQTRPNDITWNGRESKAVTLRSTYSEAIALFVNDVKWSVVSELVNELNEVVTEEFDMSQYALAGPVTDNRDGSITVKMGKYKDEEILTIPLGVAPQNHIEAASMRSVIEKAAQHLEDEVAVTVKNLYPAWEDLKNSNYIAEKSGYKFRYGTDLYTTVIDNAQFAEHWVPGVGTESMYVVIDEVHSGDQNSPIPYIGNMVLEVGKYYSQDGVVYLCSRNTEIPVYNSLSELVGLYVEVV